MAIQFKRESDIKHIGINTENGKTCSISKITQLSFPLNTEDARWRIDYNGETVDTMIVGLKRTKMLAKKVIS